MKKSKDVNTKPLMALTPVQPESISTLLILSDYE